MIFKIIEINTGNSINSSKVYCKYDDKDGDWVKIDSINSSKVYCK